MLAPAFSTPRSWRATAAIAAIVAASALVLGAALFASFRLGFVADVAMMRINGPRVLTAAVAGAALALAGRLRLAKGNVAPLGELRLLVVPALAAAAGVLAGIGRVGTARGALFAASALAAAGLTGAAVRALERRPARWTNLAAAALVLAAVASAALVGSYGRARADGVTEIALWLVGDLTGARTGATWVAAVALAVLATWAHVRAPHPASSPAGSPAGDDLVALGAFGVGVGLAGPLAFIGTFVPRAIGALAGRPPGAVPLVTTMLAGAAVVAAIDAVPRLLVGGYAFPFNVAAGILALVVFLPWNRARLRARAGPGSRVFNLIEIAIFTLLTLWFVKQIVVLVRVVGGLT